MPLNLTPYTEEDPVAASAVNGTFTQISDYANDLPEEAVERHSLRGVHLPSLFPADLLPNGPEAWPAQIQPRESYENSLPDTAGAYPLDYQAFSVAGINAPYGPSVGDVGGGWRILAYNTITTNAAQVDIESGGAAISLTTQRLKGVLVRASAYVDNATIAISESPLNYHRDSVLVAVGWQDGAGDRHIVERSIRWYSTRAIWKGEVTTATLLRQSDLDGLGDGTVANVFLAVASAARGFPSNPTRATPVVFGEYNVTAWPLHAGDLTEV
jgi:hypothetical protein